MAFSTGSKIVEFTRKLYKGVGVFNILAVNPTKEEQEKLFNTEIEKEPEYTGIKEVTINGEKKNVNAVRITFVVKANQEKHPDIDLVCNHTFFLRQQYLISNADKVKVMDKYGNSAWVTKEEFANKSIPQYANGPANIDKDYRPLMQGEEQLCNFLKEYLGIPNCFKWSDNKIVGWADNLDDCQCRLDNMEALFKGDFSELKSILSYQPNNSVKIAVGVKTTDEGKQHQATYTNMSLKANVSKYGKLEADIKTSGTQVDFTGDNNQGLLENLSEYVVTPTDFGNKDAFGGVVPEVPPFGGGLPFTN